MVNWTAEKDQIILKGIFKFHEIKNSAPLLKYLAEEIGEGCTPKAVSHRLNNIRGGGKAVGTPKKAAAATPKTPRGRPKFTPRKKTADDSDCEPEGPVDDDEEIQSPSAARGKRAANKIKVSYADSESEAEDDDGNMHKRVKHEPIEEDASFEAYAGTGLAKDEV
ncbi:hypothetical protein T440DRAFT_465413 [Plenodomus tracheiphilus IPT5]|uniref:Uncharacterized protein n=1 Tax=Plenodomus tracheiphilus IPT5 TaxID=1408161 RepID=A0A6A7BK13_9PLEO|nr:hypothetical protein T440DRAFT_465413 [Plenodomus tracheiphilus IPT5]